MAKHPDYIPVEQRQYVADLSTLDVGKTRIATEWAETEDSIGEYFSNITPPCIGKDKILGCLTQATEWTFLIPWTNLRREGIPVSLRLDPHFWVVTCLHCHLLEQSHRRRRITAWKNHVAKAMHIAPASVRMYHQDNFDKLKRILDIPRSVADDKLGDFSTNVINYTLAVGDEIPFTMTGDIVNIDWSNGKNGSITLTTYTYK